MKNVENLYPLSPMQEGMLFHSLYEPGSGVYVDQLILTIESVDSTALRRAWEVVIDRHSVLRTCFLIEQGERLQLVQRRAPFTMHEEDWQGLPAETVKTQLDRFLVSDRAHDFDLSHAPLMRVALIRTGTTSYHLVWTYHHAILDGWSLPLVLSDVFTAYEGELDRRPARMAPARQYSDYIAWLQRQDLAKAEEYWRARMRGIDAPTRLGVESQLRCSGYEERMTVLSRDLTASLDAVAQRNGLTLGTLLLGAWAILLGRYSGREDVVFGSTVSGRPPEMLDVERIAGLFINTLPVRVELSNHEPCSKWLKRLQNLQAEARRYDYTPLVQIHQWSGFPAAEPLFETVVVHENYPIDESLQGQARRLKITSLRNIDRSNYPLTILSSSEGRLRIRASYDSSRFDSPTVERILEHLHTVLERFASGLDTQLSAFSLLSEKERRHVLVEWNDTALAVNVEATLHGAFSEQAERTPEAVAVACGDDHISYRELEWRANQLARYLRRRGVKQETRVGLYLERGVELVVSMLAILKAGGCYVPIEPGPATERARWQLADSNAELMLAQESLRGEAPEGVQGCETAWLDKDSEEIAHESGMPLQVEVGGANLAYVMYTSGSTGPAKGVGVEHLQIMNHMMWMQRKYPFAVGNRILQKTAMGFDASVWEFYAALLNGGCLVLAGPGDHREPRRLAQAMDENQIEIVQVVPTVLRLLLEEPQFVGNRSVVRVFCGGEVLTAELRDRFREALPERQLINLYGPTEATIDATSWLVTEGEVGLTVPIGRPIANTKAYVLDPQGEPVPVGIRGELYLAGAAVARGYLGDAALTADRFLPDPWSVQRGARMYRTGDLVRWRGDGVLEYLARIDDQVKIRGQRVELGEIEAALASHRRVRQAVVTIAGDETDHLRLVAYVVPVDEEPLQTAELRRYLQPKLPGYMIPSAVVVMEQLPLNSSGKVDLRALPPPESTRPELEQGYTAPRNAIEEILAGIWEEVLGIDRVGVEDNFFALGGHSLLATQVVSRIRNQMGKEISLRRIFDLPTVAAIAATLGQSQGTEMPPLSRTRRVGTIPLSFAQQRLWFLDQLVPGNCFYNMPSALRLGGPLEVRSLEQTLGEVVRRHEVLRTHFVSEQGGVRQEISAWEPLSLEVEEVDQIQAVEAAREEARRPFDLGRGPLLRARILRLGAEDHVLLLTMHHIVSDGWSLGVLVGELSALYNAYCKGEEPALDDLPVQYADYAIWQRNWLKGEILEQQLGYWKKKLAGLAPLELPADRPRPATQSFEGSSQRMELSSELSESLRQLSRREGTTLFMTLLAVFQVLLAKYTGQRDIAVGSAVANRERKEIEPLIGFFVNMLVLRTDLGGNPTFRELLSRVRETALDAYTHQSVPFEQVVEELEPDRDLNRSPLFQVGFTVQNTPRSEQTIRDLHKLPFDPGLQATRYDLEVHFSEAEGALGCLFVYSTSLYDEKRIRRMIAHFETLLQAAVDRPDGHISEFSLLSPAEREQVLYEWNRTTRKLPSKSSFVELFEAQVERTPYAIAVTCGELELSYEQLNQRANQLARYLGTLGVGPEVRVGICMNRSLDLLVSLVGVLKAGGAYVPLDPDHASERLNYMLEDAQAPILLTESRLLERLQVGWTQAICLDTDWAQVEEQAIANLHTAIIPDHAAYLIYTSGSTGRPKGVIVTHGGLANHLTWRNAACALTTTDNVLQVVSIGFDASVWGFFGPLISGAACVLAPVRYTLDDLTNLINRTRTTVLAVSTRLIDCMLTTRAELIHLRHLFCGGESLMGATVKKFQRLSIAEIDHLYGPTEASVDASVYRCSNVDLTKVVPIGRPTSNVQIYVLDSEMEPLAAGQTGELYIGGLGVARGYFGRPDLTAEQFRPDALSGRPGARLYRTGDLARWSEDGTLEFVGRLDSQVKIRGHRIEPGEIEAALVTHPAVSEALVDVREESTGDKRLIAYVKVAPAAHAESDDARQQHVSRWRELYDDMYAKDSSGADETFNIAGWNSSYTGKPISTAEMREWVTATVNRIRQLHPQRVLEIGAGAGLLLFRIAPYCSEYWGSDFSQRALSYLERQLDRDKQKYQDVHLTHREADDFTGFDDNSFDTVILNSVAQYFPDPAYLMRTLEGAIRIVRPGGTIFVGDLRNLALLDAFHASVQVFQSPASTPIEDVRRRVTTKREHDPELLVSPHFFSWLKQVSPKVGWTEIELKRGDADNELTRFRYDAIVHLGDLPCNRFRPEWLNWREKALTLSELAKMLENERREVVGIQDVPNARVLEDVVMAELLISEECQNVGEIRSKAHKEKGKGVEPEHLIQLAASYGYKLQISWARGSRDGSYDALFILNSANIDCEWIIGDFESQSVSELVSNPLMPKLARGIGSEISKYLQDKLPAYMVPDKIVPLQRFPLNESGKIKREALPILDTEEIESEEGYGAPWNPIEEILAGIWEEVLGIDRVGVEENFFALGGHSLLGTQLISRVRDLFHVDLPLAKLFEAPTIRGLADALGKLQEIVAPPLMAAQRVGAIPLSFAQQRLWFLDQLVPGNCFYNMPMALRLGGPLEVRPLEQTLGEVIRRHEVLRTHFVSEQGGVRQEISAWEPLLLEVEEVDQIQAVEVAHEEARRPFDLKYGPLLRVRVLRLGAEDHVLLLTMHHIVSDGWSLGVLVGELSALYNAYCKGEEPALDDLPVQYADYAIWQRDWLKGEILEQQLGYWKKKLAGLAPLELPADRPRPATRSFEGSSQQMELSSELSESLRQLSRREGTTLFMTLLAVFQVLLAKYTGQRDIAVGSAVANRERKEIEPLIGFFVNMLVLRTDLGGNPTFRELLSRVRETALEAYAHQSVPFEQVVEELEPDRDLSRSPLFQVIFAGQNTPMSSIELAEIGTMSFVAGAPVARYDLEVHFSEAEGALGCLFVYSTSLYDEKRIRRMIAHFETLLQAAVDRPDGHISEFSLLSSAEREQVLYEWNRTTRELPANSSFVELFEAQVERTPHAIAVTCGELELSYEQLNQRANQLARYLRTLGVGPEVRVGICMDRSLDLLVSLVGVLKAGGAYVPLDPDHASERLNYMLEDAQAPILLTESRLLERLQVGWTQAICLDTDWAQVEEQAVENLHTAIIPDHAAYLIYTSGSTGRPKGVIVTHGGLANYLSWSASYYPIDGTHGMPVHSSIAFDLTVTGFYTPLISGNRVILFGRSMAFHGLVDELFNERQFDLLKVTPAHLELISRRIAKSARKPSLRGVIVGGEALFGQQIAAWRDYCPETRIINEYGPTEAVVGCCIYEVHPSDPQFGSVPIGRPIANTRLYVLDEFMEPVGAGVTGELYIGGAGVARGYLNRPELTAERFLPDPFSGSGERLYRTGDLARWREDGVLDFLGRIDEQIKIKGYRIEPGEIEGLLREVEGVTDVAVVAREDESRNKRLVAYVVGDEASPRIPGGYQLPNGWKIAHQNKNETDYLYKEIFESRVYLQGGIHLAPNACIFDVGANIGLFTLFADDYCDNARIFSFEPIPDVFESLRANVSLCLGTVKAFPFGLSDTEKVEEFTYYPRSSMMSGMATYADKDEEARVVRQFLKNEVRKGLAESALIERTDDLLDGRFEGQVRSCRVRTLSNILREEQVERVHLLKIDVERAELDVLMGIDAEDWAKIDQIVIEAHDHVTKRGKDLIRQIVTLLEARGYSTVIEQDDLLEGTGMYNIYAVRRDRMTSDPFYSQPSIHREREKRVALSEHVLKSFLESKLPQYMCPSAIVMLKRLPLNSNGKIDRNALPAPIASRRTEVSTPAADALELELAAVYKSVLNLTEVDVTADFFALGGESLSAVRLIEMISERVGRTLQVATLFQHGSIRQLACAIRDEKMSPLSSRSNPIVPINIGEGTPLFVVNPVGGTSVCFAALARELGNGQPFYALEDFRAQPDMSLRELARYYAEAIRSIQPVGPYFVGGYSFGGVIAFEVAQQLRNSGVEVDLLFLIDSAAPLKSVTWIKSLARFLGVLEENSAPAYEAADLERIAACFKLHKMFPADMGESRILEGLKLCLSMLRLSENYTPDAYSQRVLLLRAAENDFASPEKSQDAVVLPEFVWDEIVQVMKDRTMGWSEVCNGPIEIQEIPGDHFSIIRAPNVAGLAEKLSIAIRGVCELRD